MRDFFDLQCDSCGSYRLETGRRKRGKVKVSTVRFCARCGRVVEFPRRRVWMEGRGREYERGA